MRKKYFCISLGAVLALAVVFGGVLGNPFLIKDVLASSTVGPSVTFSDDGGTEDLGVTTYVMVPRTWTVEIPGNYEKVETTHYDKPTPDTVKKYMGWNGYAEVSGEKLWKFLSWSSGTGGVIQDYVLDQQVYESTGVGKWVDATEFFQAGANTVQYYHYTEGGGIGLKIRVTTEVRNNGEDGDSCSVNSECNSGYCVNSYCRSSATYCGDDVCDTGETCSSCPAECGLCDGKKCSAQAECESGYCVNNYCRASSIYCGDNVCDTGESCSSCVSDCGNCEEPKKPNMSLCVSATECEGGYCVNGKCLTSPTRCMDGQCDSDKGETCALCPEDCSCERGGCCSANSDNANFRGCVSQSTKKGSLVCCNEKYSYGECCSSADCSLDTECVEYKCVVGDEEPAAPEGGEPRPGSEDSGREPENTPDGKECTLDDQCEGGYCVNRICRSTATFCGDDRCDKPENCSNCKQDCGGQDQKCCSTTARWADSRGYVVSNQLTKKGYICCNGKESFGECRQDLDCPGYDKLCIKNRCVAKADCGNGYCEPGKGENCSICANDCSCYNSEACVTDLARSDSYGCLRLRYLKFSERPKIKYIWCKNFLQDGQCCLDSDCSESEECNDSVCEAKVECGDWICQSDQGENCKNCFEDCGCLGGECCEPRFSNNAKGCISSDNKITDEFMCCAGDNQYGECCSDSQCADNKECVNNWCQVRPQCGDGKCNYDRGESCAACPNDCLGYNDDCCAPDSQRADVFGWILTGQQYGSQICCNGDLEMGECCCSDSQCSAGEQCIANRCTKFIEAFYRYYYEKEVGYGGKWVKPTDAYRGIAQFYKNQADYIDSPVIAFGQFVKILDTMSDATRSIVGADIIGLGIALNNFRNQMGDWYLSDPDKFQSNLLLSYSAGSLLLEASGRSGTMFQDAAIRGLHAASPNNRLLDGVSSRHLAFQQKIGMNSKAAANQLFIINIADLVMDNTLLAGVDEHLGYDVMDYMQKIQLAMIANLLADLYQKADDRSLTEDEVFALIMMEKEFWVAVVARCANTINFTEMQKEDRLSSLWNAMGANYDLTIETEKDMINTAEGWLRAVEERKNQLFREYFGYLQRKEKAVQGPSPFRALINVFTPANSDQ